jgi:hypothetical protein
VKLRQSTQLTDVSVACRAADSRGDWGLQWRSYFAMQQGTGRRERMSLPSRHVGTVGSPRGIRWCYPARMTRHISLQQATAEHYDFALRLYLLTMRPYMEELDVWDERQQKAVFAAQWKREEVRNHFS